MNDFLGAGMLEFKFIGDERGSLVICDGSEDIPFDPKRVFYIFDSDSTVVRGNHANRRTQLVLINVSGSSRVRLKDGRGNEQVYLLNRPHTGIYIPNMIWKEMYDFSSNCILLCLASEHYDASEYIRDYDAYTREMLETPCGAGKDA